MSLSKDEQASAEMTRQFRKIMDEENDPLEIERKRLYKTQQVVKDDKDFGNPDDKKN